MDLSLTTVGTVQWFASGNQKHRLRFAGNWTLSHLPELETRLNALKPGLREATDVDFSALGHMDTAGAGLIAAALGPECLRSLAKNDCRMPRKLRGLMDTVSDAVAEIYAQRPSARSHTGPLEVMGRLGDNTIGVWHLFLRQLGFVGLTLETGMRALKRPGRWRISAVTVHMEKAGLDAVPIVALLSFLIGGVIALLGARALRQFGADLLAINLVSFAFVRELAALLTAILLAGRTASAFTAQIGGMQADEEIDAMRTMALDPIELLVLPRTLALVIVGPLLTFVSMLSGVLGGLVVCWLAFGIAPHKFAAVFQTITTVHDLSLGLGKAVVSAFMIAVIGCMEGFEVKGNAQSVGQHTTSSVVQSIFMVIVVDALAAVFFLEMGW
jgi:phospholipid/cholesterol/gamma-HCH transport system permease protein